MKTSSKILVGVSGALLAAFAVKSFIDYSRYTKTVNSAPFDIRISLNALFLVIPAALLAAIALIFERKTCVLGFLAAVFAAISVEEFIRNFITRFPFLDSFLLTIPYFAVTGIFLLSAWISAVFMIVSTMKKRG